ncbi:hypothetical protein CORC01_12396 [Colletotrichum orchidophilum]|uniref:DUF4440 domain-containing protein n=1 Tax=Colletotrichum orchidophilum TaxID=1209926 RepID=A0A1G4AT48_9PEZI|nr:uncharacterized protein CORC01_12396 [Colletotrichum orchidophilum]OHE92334.1 hypothetical protein CORC01_12396 [Colletotrichum orchidophilum]
MPSVLGLTTDPSPHGPGAEQKQKKKKPQFSGIAEDANLEGKQLTRREKKSDGQSPEDKKKKKSSSSSKAKKEKKEDRPSKAMRHYSSDEEEDSEDEGPLNTIKLRNHAKAIEMETLLWGALCHKPKSALKYVGKGAIMCNPILFGDAEVYSERSEPTLKEMLKEHADPPMSFKMHKPHVCEVGLMAMSICCDITIFRMNDDNELEAEECQISSSWRQCASGDWEMASSMAGWQE